MTPGVLERGVLNLAVVVVPLVPGWDGVNGVPVLDDFVVSDSIEIVEGAIGLTKHAFADAEDEIALREHSMDRLVAPRWCLGGLFTQSRQQMLDGLAVLETEHLETDILIGEVTVLDLVRGSAPTPASIANSIDYQGCHGLTPAGAPIAGLGVPRRPSQADTYWMPG
jgi:hypothetical protein